MTAEPVITCLPVSAAPSSRATAATAERTGETVTTCLPAMTAPSFDSSRGRSGRSEEMTGRPVICLLETIELPIGRTGPTTGEIVVTCLPAIAICSSTSSRGRAGAQMVGRLACPQYQNHRRIRHGEGQGRW